MKQILLIETEFYTRVRLDDELAERGYQVTSVKRPRDGFFKMKAQAFNALLVSYDKDISGVIRILATLRQTGNNMPALILAKKPTEEQLIQLMSYRPIEVVVKPYSSNDLIERLDHMLGMEAGS
jgi:DNA-binding response OmpR family regulator